MLQQTDARAELIRVLATARSLAAGKFQINRATHDRRTIEQAQRIYDDFVSAGWVSATLGPNKVFYPGVVGVMISGKTVDKYPDLLEPIQRAFLCLGIGVDIDPTKNSFTLDKEVVEIFVAHIR